MSVVKPDVIVISSDDEDDCDGERNLDRGLELVHDSGYCELDGHESDKEAEDAVEKSNEEECRDNCDERRDKCDPFNLGGKDLQELSLYECKTYLRKHGMRVSGTKEECIQRIKEHGSLKDGMGESLYPRSSFSIICTGDVCKGDVVLFKQNMYNSQRKIIGIRTVAGRIAKESYGASMQQHTFSVEVLWSKWSKKLNPLSILLVKGRNLYKFGTTRQPWESEAERSKVLREKHERGRAARQKRNLRKKEFASGDGKGTKLYKVSRRGPSQSKHITRIDTHKHVNENITPHNQAVWFQNTELKRLMQLANHSDHHLQEASSSFSYDKTLLPNNLLPFAFAGYSRNNNGQGPNQAFSLSSDHHHQNNELLANRLKDEKAKSHFPESSFTINCTGDARIGDIVLFKAKKKRTIAGRIDKVRKCGSKDEHKFMIRVLWATPYMNLKRRFTLQVKSHKLYKFGTFRQPWKNEADRSKLAEEKQGPPMHKRKLRKTDIALNKNKGAKRQKLTHNGASQSKQSNQIGKHKSSKKKGASATPVKETKTARKRKAVQLQKTKVKKSKPQTSHSDLNSDLSVSITPNPNPRQNPNPISSSTPNLNPHPNSKHKSSKKKKKKGASATPVKETKKAHKRKSVQLQKTKFKKSKPQTLHSNLNSDLSVSITPNPNPCQNPNPILSAAPNPNKCKNLNLNTRQNLNRRQKPNSRKNLNPNPHPNPNTHKNLNPNRRKNLNPRSKPNTHKNLNPNTRPDGPDPNSSPHPYPNYPNSYPNLYPYPQLNLNSNPHPNVTPQPNLNPPLGFLSNQPPNWFSPNQPQPFGYPGYGGEWGPNHAFLQPPGYYDYNQLLVQCVTALLYLQQPL